MASIRKLIPLADRVLIKRIEPLTKTAGGILLPDSAQTKEKEGEVIAVGPGTDKVKMTVVQGDKVLLPEYGGQTVKINDEELFLFRNDDLLAKFES